MHLPHLNMNEALVSRVVQLSPAGTEFLKPVVFEIPHFGALQDTQRELVSFVCNTQTWREHTTCNDDEGEVPHILGRSQSSIPRPPKKKNLTLVELKDTYN